MPDIMGRTLMNYLLGDKDAHYVIEREGNCWDKPQQAAVYFSAYEDWSPLDQMVVDRAHGRILDIGAGAGRHSLYLQNKGLDVNPIDISPLAVETMHMRGLSAARCMDMWQLDYSYQSFDTIMLMFNGLGLAGHPQNTEELLRYLHGFARPGGQLLTTILDPYDTTDPRHLEYHAQNRARGRFGGQVRIRLTSNGDVGDWFDLLLMSQDELYSIVNNTCWVVREILKVEGSPIYAPILVRQ